VAPADVVLITVTAPSLRQLTPQVNCHYPPQSHDPSQSVSSCPCLISVLQVIPKGVLIGHWLDTSVSPFFEPLFRQCRALRRHGPKGSYSAFTECYPDFILFSQRKGSSITLHFFSLGPGIALRVLSYSAYCEDPEFSGHILHS